MSTAHFDFHAELNDFLPHGQRDQTITYFFRGHPGIKDPIEAIGIPHPEIALILVNGNSVGFDYQLHNGDRVSTYPNLEQTKGTPLVQLRDDPPPRMAFILDVNLGKLAKRLRLCGFDAKYSNDCIDRHIADISLQEKRIVLTRDRRLLHIKTITHGCWVRSTDPDTQLKEVLKRFDLNHRIRPFHRCIDCNGVIQTTSKAAVMDQLEPLTKKYYEEFCRCMACGKVYWKGSHYEHMVSHLTQLLS